MPRGDEHISFVFSGKIVMGKKILLPCLDVISSSLVLEIWSFTIYFSGKRRSLLHPNKAQGSFFQ